jgi:hypothetical protein
VLKKSRELFSTLLSFDGGADAGGKTGGTAGKVSTAGG